MAEQAMVHTLSLENLPTFEQFWASFLESRREFDRRMQELRELSQETAIAMKETDRRLKKTEKLVKDNGKHIGGLHNSFGELAEHLVAPGIAKRFNKIGFHFDCIAGKGLQIYEKGKIKAEIDILLENSDYIIAVEVKGKVQVKYGKDNEHDDITHHIQRLNILREHRQEDKRKILGAIAGAIFGPDAREAAIQAGFFVLEQSGDTMKMDMPEGFRPKEW
ncbi:MAG: hypothetical protein FWG89_03600 [Treponema sp.]|nr:hypothetical protein [Treponema sp.]